MDTESVAATMTCPTHHLGGAVLVTTTEPGAIHGHASATAKRACEHKAARVVKKCRGK